MADHPLLTVENLSVEFHARGKIVQAVRNVSGPSNRGETLAILGESGSGKSVSSAAVMGLIDTPAGYITSGQCGVRRPGSAPAAKAERRRINGRRIAMIFQDPLAASEPGLSGRLAGRRDDAGAWRFDQAEARAGRSSLLERVGIPTGAAERRLVSARVLRRAAPARHDRHGGRDEARPADRRRTHHRPGRHRAGADPGPAFRTARRNRHGAGADHP